MKIFSKRQLFTIVFALTFAFLFIFRVYAAPSAVWYSNFAGVTTAIAEKNVSYTSPSTFYCMSRSYTNYPSFNITHLGYNTFSCNVWKDGKYADGWTRSGPGSVNWNSSNHSDSGTVSVSFTQGQARQVIAAGSHDFGHFDGQSHDWDPLLSATGNYP